MSTTPRLPRLRVGPSLDVIDTLLAERRFSRLSHALIQANLVADLKAEGPFTFFAPVDSAFEEVPSEELDALFRDPERMHQAFRHHIVPGAFRSWNLPHGRMKTLAGTIIMLGATDDGFTVESANSIGKDLHSSNGVVHAIDAFNIPGRVTPRSEESRRESPWSGKKSMHGRPRIAVK
jgi:uncharacterized surface protein with fasciclin (FAS1) repeats